MPLYASTDDTGPSHSNKPKKTEQNDQSAQTKAIQGIFAAITQIQQQYSQELKNNEDQKKSDQNVSGKIGTYTFWLVIVGGIQGLILAVTVAVLIRQDATTKNSERAWVIGTEPTYATETNAGKIQNFVYSCSIRNVGKTPSRISEVGLTIRKTDSFEKIAPDPTPTYREGEIRRFNGIIVVPNESLPVKAAKLSEELSWTENTAIADKKLFIYAYGFIKYLDAFDHERESRFCHRYFAPTPGETEVTAYFGPCIAAPSKYHEAT